MVVWCGACGAQVHIPSTSVHLRMLSSFVLGFGGLTTLAIIGKSSGSSRLTPEYTAMPALRSLHMLSFGSADTPDIARLSHMAFLEGVVPLARAMAMTGLASRVGSLPLEFK